MIFRPLCIDYHSRAHEIVIAAESESSNNNNALRLLPTPPNFDERNLYNELEKEDNDTNDGVDETEGSFFGSSGDGVDENGEVSILFISFDTQNVGDIFIHLFYYHHRAALIIYHSLTNYALFFSIFIPFIHIL